MCTFCTNLMTQLRSLCGRGGSINAHPGNRVFRSWIQDYKSTYNLASTKAEKSRVVNIILDKVRKLNPPGRFLQKVSTNSSAELCMANSDDGWWEEIDEVKAMAKISQALREGAPAFRAAHGKGKGNKNKEQSSRRRSSTGGVAMSAGAKPSKRKSTLDKHISFETSPKIKRRSSMANANPSPDVDAKASPSPPTAGHVPFSHDTDQHMHDHDLEIGELNNIFAFNNDSDELAIGNDNGKAMENVKSQGMISKGAPPLEPHPLVPNSDFNASIADVAAAIPPTPPTVKKQSVASLYHENAFGNVITPHLQPSSSTPPPVSPYETAQAGPGLMSPTHHWDPLAFFSPTTPKAVTNLNSEKIGEQSLIKTPSSFYMNRTHSLSLSDLNDFHGSELGEFTNPFENEDELKCAKSSSNSSGGGCAGRPGINSCAPLSKPPLLDLQNRRHSLNFQPGYSQMLPPPYTKTVTSNIMGSTQVPPSTHIGAPPFNLPFGNIPPPSPMDSLPPRGLSFGRLGSVPKGYLGRKSTSSSVSRDSTNASSIGKRNQNNVRRHDSSSTEKDSKKSMNTGVPNSFLCYEHFRSVMH